VRSLTDLRNRRIYVKQESVGAHSPRAIVLQALSHFLLDHQVPRDFAHFLRQRVEANYFAAAVLMPETSAVSVLVRAKQDRDLAVEDLVDLFSVSYEMTAHRFTNLATHHLDLPCHFVKNDASGIIYKAYGNDGVVFPADPSGAIDEDPVGLPRRGVLQPAARRSGRTVGGPGLALGPRALAHPGGAARRQLPRRRRRRHLRVPRPPRPGIARAGSLTAA
jgi:hypothetical protein